MVFQHPSVAALRRELRRNPLLRWECGFDPLKGETAVPRDWVYTRFLRSPARHGDLIEAMFDRLVEELREQLRGFGSVLAMALVRIQQEQEDALRCLVRAA